MPANRRVLIVLGVVVGLVGPQAVEAQAIELRYRPAIGRNLRTVSWHEVAVTVGDLPSAPGGMAGDTLRLDVEVLQSIAERVVGSQGGRYAVERAVDSTRGRSRAMSGSWRDLEFGDSAGPPAARMRITERLQIEDFVMTTGDTASPSVQWLRNPGGMFELTFPETRVSAGDSWTTEVVFPLTLSMAGIDEPGAEIVEGAALVSRATLTLDSVVARGTDTLAFLQMRGTFLPLSVSPAAETAEAQASVSGGIAGYLLWSTGWDAWVSGTARTQITVRTRLGPAEQGPPEGFEMRVRQDTRFQVRP